NPLRLKDWQHFAVFGPDFLFTFVVFNAHYLNNTFCYFVDRMTGAMSEHHREGLPFRAKLAQNLWNDGCSYRSPGYNIEIQNRLQSNRHFAQVDIAAKGSIPALGADLEMVADIEKHQPLIVVLKAGENRPVYSHKMACPVKGKINVGGREIILDERKNLVLIDVHKAYYPYFMKWTWASGAGFNEQGEVVGFNLTHNVLPDDETNNENALWVGNKLSMFGAARFKLDESDTLKPWSVATTDGRCRIDFKAEGKRSGKINAGLISSDYHQPYGSFNGTAVDDDGVTHIIKDFFGVTELHKARF
ncbi:MAG: DUF2804 domain-containing protein, partial [Myxococcota bacterium]